MIKLDSSEGLFRIAETENGAVLMHRKYEEGEENPEQISYSGSYEGVLATITISGKNAEAMDRMMKEQTDEAAVAVIQKAMAWAL